MFTYNRLKKQDVHSNEMKLFIIMHKVKAYFPTHTKAGIGLELSKLQINLMYKQVFVTFWSKCNRKFTPHVSMHQPIRRNIQ